jgi:hypothetical protein
MREELERVYESVRAWCRARGYAGHDPFDALNSPVFRATPFNRSRLARLAWTQAFKRAPFSPRSLALVPAEKNSKGTALFALASLSRLRATSDERHAEEARELLADLLDSRVRAPSSGARAWGYNFDWQGRAFYAPRGTPTVVPTAFAVRALVEAAEAFGTQARAGVRGSDYVKAAREACEFILQDLNRSEDAAGDELCFSYTPLDRTRVFNASLLAAEALASVGALTLEDELRETALRATRYVVRRMRADGSWPYGADSYQSWADNFHTAFVLTSLARIVRVCGAEPAGVRDRILRAISRGYDAWRTSFFLADGWPKYYHHSAHPADAHSAGAAVVACAELSSFEPGARTLAESVTRWAVRELFDARGFFYYQRRRLYTVRTPYMRWSQAWMTYALARMLETERAMG